MFEDILKEKEVTEEEPLLHICTLINTCNEEFCLHKQPHYQNELGRPEQPDDDSPCDCSKIKCGKHLAVCIPI